MAGPTTAKELVMLCGSAVVLALFGAAVLRRLPRGGICAHGVQVLRDFARVIFRPEDVVGDKLGERVCSKIEEMRVLHARVYMQCLAFLMFPFTAHMLLTVCMGWARPFTVPQDIMALVAHCTYAAALAFPSVVNRKTLRPLCIVLALAASAGMVACDSNTIAIAWMSGVGGTLSIQNFTCRDILVVTVTNITFTAAACSALWAHADEVDAALLGCMFLCLLGLINTIFPRLLDFALERIVRGGFENKSAQQILEAATALLKGFADAIVEIDGSTTIVGHAESLGGFLMREARPLLGRRLVDLLPDDGEQRCFLARLRVPRAGEGGLAEAIHVCMKDADGTVLRLQLLWFSFVHADATLRYMVGIRDLSTDDPTRLPRLPRGLHGALPQVLPAPLSPPSFQSGTLTSESSDSDREALAFPAFDEVPDLPEAHAIIHSRFDQGCLLARTSAGFAACVGRLPIGSRFLDSVKHPEDFVNWLEQAVTEMTFQMTDPELPPWEDEGTKLVLLMPQGEVSVRCQLRELRSSGGHDVEDEEFFQNADQVVLVFSSIRPRHRGARHHATQAQRRSPPTHASL